MKIVKKIVFVFCFFIFWSPFSQAHPFYVSICQIDYNKENSSLEISIKIFADDTKAYDSMLSGLGLTNSNLFDLNHDNLEVSKVDFQHPIFESF